MLVFFFYIHTLLSLTKNLLSVSSIFLHTCIFFDKRKYLERSCYIIYMYHVKLCNSQCIYIAYTILFVYVFFNSIVSVVRVGGQVKILRIRFCVGSSRNNTFSCIVENKGCGFISLRCCGCMLYADAIDADCM